MWETSRQEIMNRSVSIVVPVRNEAGNLEAVFEAVLKLALPRVELIFIEGGSTDGTWEHLQILAPQYSLRHNLAIKLLRQRGTGKADAVRIGFENAVGEYFMILDGDLTVAPEDLVRFYEVLRSRSAELVVGTRWLLPFEKGAMRPLNVLGNMFFTKLVNLVLGTKLTDLLCGMKALSRESYQRICVWREENKFEDPFGDFELIFGARSLGMQIQEIPVRYKARTYGRSNISRFRDGLQLLRMTLLAGYLRGQKR